MEGIEPWRVRQAYLFWTENPDHWEDISCCVDVRIAALLRHASQVGAEPEKLVERIRQRAGRPVKSQATRTRRRSNALNSETW